MTIKNLLGKKFGRLLVIEKTDERYREQVIWKCKCDCGNIVNVPSPRLTTGNTKSCGCMRRTLTNTQFTKHGKSRTRLYKIWCNMKERCYNPNHTYFRNYGGRGIKICDEWCNDFTIFQKWALAHGYKDNLSIDRIDNNKNYGPQNCKWATKQEQANNRRTNKLIKYHGETLNKKQWAKKIGMNYGTFLSRVKAGWTMDQIVLGFKG